MWKILIIPIFLFVYLFDFKEKEDVIVNAGIFKVLYSQEMEQPLEVWYKVECPNGTASRKGMDFYVCDSIHTSSAEDYENNVWDKGHMAPAASFSCNGNMIYQTFTYLNCALQHQDLNRVTWRFLEERERQIANQTEVKVHIKLDFVESPEKVPGGACIPKGFWKDIEYGRIKESYYFPNEKPKYKDYFMYKVE
jgi:DNA/RNA endonuclease G (NUC1)